MSNFTFSYRKIKKSTLLTNAFFLTMAGFLSRIIGFFYRIFVSGHFGAEAMGLYQLSVPIVALAYSLFASGFQTAISKITASEQAGNRKKGIGQGLLIGTLTALMLSFICCFFTYYNAEWIASYWIREKRTAPLLKILSLSFPISCTHSCINGYFFGRKKAFVPAVGQLVEQVFRISGILLLYSITPSVEIIALGVLIGETASAIVSLYFLWRKGDTSITSSRSFTVFTALLSLAVPLCANRLITNLLQSLESITIPMRLRTYGLSQKEALSNLGILTGMALPTVLFPTAITNAIAVMLLPMISEAQALSQKNRIRHAIKSCIRYCFLLGSICSLLFFLFGDFTGRLLFHNAKAGSFIRILGFICPFLYLNTTLSSILHGLGQTFRTFLFNMLSLFIRLFFVTFFIPYFGMSGYLAGLLISQLILCSLHLLAVRKYL